MSAATFGETRLSHPALLIRRTGWPVAFGMLLLSLAAFMAFAPLRWAALGLAAAGLIVAVFIEPVVGLLAIAALIPWGGLIPLPVPVVGAIDALVGLTIAAWLAREIAVRREIRLRPPALTVALLLFVWVAGVTLTQAFSWSDGLPEWFKWVEFAALYIAAAQLLGPRSRWFVVAALFIGALSQAALGAYQFVFRAGPEGFILPGGFMRAFGTLDQPNPYAGYLGYTAPLAASLALAALIAAWRKRSPRLLILAALLAAIAGAIAAGILMSWSRGAWLGLAAALAAVAGLRNWRTAAVTAGVVIALALVIGVAGTGWLPSSISSRVADLGAYFSIPDPARTEINDANFSVLERLAHWNAGLRMFDDAPWLGVGIGNYGVNYGRYPQPHWYEPLGHAHNVFINFAAETGVVGLAAFLIFWLAVARYAWRTGWRSKNPWNAALALGVLGAWVYLTVHSLFDNLFVQHLQLQLALLLAALQAGDGQRANTAGQARRMNRGLPFGSVMTTELPQFLDTLLRLPGINRLGLADRPRELVRFLKFAAVGMIGMVVDLTVLTISREWLRLPLSLAVFLGFTLAVISNFTWNRLWTFPESRERPIGSQLLQFFIINAIGLGINEVVVLGLHPVFNRVVHDPASYMAAKVIAIGIVLFWNYFVNRKWTYKGIS